MAKCELPVEALRTLGKLEPGDVIVVEVSARTSHEQAERIREAMVEHFGGHLVVITVPGMGIRFKARSSAELTIVPCED
jgi:hypothetical protein